MTKEEVEDAFGLILDNYDCEEVLEMFDLDPIEAFTYLFYAGLVNEETLRDLSRYD